MDLQSSAFNHSATFSFLQRTGIEPVFLPWKGNVLTFRRKLLLASYWTWTSTLQKEINPKFTVSTIPPNKQNKKIEKISLIINMKDYLPTLTNTNKEKAKLKRSYFLKNLCHF